MIADSQCRNNSTKQDFSADTIQPDKILLQRQAEDYQIFATFNNEVPQSSQILQKIKHLT